MRQIAKDKVVKPQVYQDVASLAWQYLDVLQDPLESSSLDRILSPVWNGKIATAEGLVVLDRATRGGLLRKTSNFEVTSIQIYYGDFAMVRSDDRSEAGVSYLTLFQSNGQWQVSSEVYTHSSFGARHVQFSHANSADEVLKGMDIYYRAVELGEPSWLENLFHADWHMKNPENGVIVSEGKRAFMARLAQPLPGYYEDRQVTDIQILYDHMAIVRIDKPSTRSTTMFTFFKIDSHWQMVDKAWSNPQSLET